MKKETKVNITYNYEEAIKLLKIPEHLKIIEFTENHDGELVVKCYKTEE